MNTLESVKLTLQRLGHNKHQQGLKWALSELYKVNDDQVCKHASSEA